MASPPLPGRRRHTNIAVSRAGTPADRPSPRTRWWRSRPPPSSSTEATMDKTQLTANSAGPEDQGPQQSAPRPAAGAPPPAAPPTAGSPARPKLHPAGGPRPQASSATISISAGSGLVSTDQRPPGSPIADEVLRRLGRCSRRDPLTPAGRRTGGNLRLAAGGLINPTSVISPHGASLIHDLPRCVETQLTRHRPREGWGARNRPADRRCRG
jgi:hypothetical protein